MHIVRDTTLELGHLVWAIRPPGWTLVLVAKATFDLQHEAEATLAATQLPVQGEIPDEELPELLRFDSDLVPFKARAECYLVGHCHAPEGVPVRHLRVGFQLGGLKKTLHVSGDRHWIRRFGVARVSEAEPFATMPLSWAYAFGGADEPNNPAGRGLADTVVDGEKKRVLPNLEDPDRPVANLSDRPTPAGAFPVPGTWASRRRKLGTYDKAWRRERWPFFPKDFDPTYYNVAPPELQQNSWWTCEEEVVATNLHPTLPTVRTQLPGLRPRCFVEHKAGAELAFTEVLLHCDTLVLNADEAQVHAVFRGHHEVADDTLGEVVRVYLAHELAGESRTADQHRARLYELDGAALVRPPPHAEPIPPESPAPSPASETIQRTLGTAPPVNGVAVSAAAPAANPPPVSTEESTRLRTFVMERLEAGEPLVGLDLSGADLSDLELPGADLSGAILQGAKLRGLRAPGARFDGADLSDADLSDAVLTGASFVRCDLTRAGFHRATLEDARLDRAVGPRAVFDDGDLARASLREADFSGGSFQRAKLSQSVLDEAELSRAKLHGADLSEASLLETRLMGAWCAQARFVRAMLGKLRASEGAVFDGADLSEARAAESVWEGASLRGAKLRRGDFAQADFAQANLERAVLDGCELSRARFPGAKLEAASMLGANAMGAVFELANLHKLDARGSNFYGAQFWRANTAGLQLELANLDGTLLAEERRS